MPGLRFSGSNQRWPSLHSQWIFSHVTITSPRMASSMALPESRADTLHIQHTCVCYLFVCTASEYSHTSRSLLREWRPAWPCRSHVRTPCACVRVCVCCCVHKNRCFLARAHVLCTDRWQIQCHEISFDQIQCQQLRLSCQNETTDTFYQPKTTPADGLLVLDDELEQDLQHTPAIIEAGLLPHL